MKKVICLTLLFLIVSMTSSAAPKGFNKGPYFLLNAGFIHYTVDNNARTGRKVGRNIEPAFGFDFGWNITDEIAPELLIRYATNKNNGNREHIVNTHLSAVYNFLINGLVNHKIFHIIPIVKAGLVAQLAAIPGDPLSNDDKMAVWGIGPSFSAGVRAMITRYFYCGINGETNFIHLPAKYQEISGTKTKILSGGWDLQLGLVGEVGVHF